MATSTIIEATFEEVLEEPVTGLTLVKPAELDIATIETARSPEEITKALATVKVSDLSPVQVFTPGVLDAIIDKVKAEALSKIADYDASTEEGRNVIKSAAFGVAKEKNSIDSKRKELVGDVKRKLSAVDAEGKRIWETLESFQKEVRRPVTEFEERESLRKQEHEGAVLRIGVMANFNSTNPVDFEDVIRMVNEEFNGREWEEFGKRALDTRTSVVAQLQVKQIAAERELGRRRAEAEEQIRLKAEREKAIADAAAKAATELAEKRAREREERLAAEAQAAAKAEAQRVAREQAEAAAKAAAEQKRAENERLLAETKARAAEVARQQAEANAKESAERALKAERDRVAAIEAARFKAEQMRAEMEAKAARDAEFARIQAEADKGAAIAAERAAQAERERQAAAEQAARDKDRAHKKAFNTEAVADLMKLGVPGVALSQAQAQMVLVGIAKAQIAHVKIHY